jgi:hypothetical protein
MVLLTVTDHRIDGVDLVTAQSPPFAAAIQSAVAAALSISTAAVAVVSVTGSPVASNAVSTPAVAAQQRQQQRQQQQRREMQQASTGDLAYSSLSSKEKSDLFESFKKTFGKVYASADQEDTAYDNFKDFLKLVDDRNTAEAKEGRGTGVHGITKFADLSTEEFSKMLGSKSSFSENCVGFTKIETTTFLE